MGEDEFDAGIFAHGSVEHEARHRAGFIEGQFEDGGRGARVQGAAAIGGGGMDEDHGLAAVQFGEDGVEARVPRPAVVVARQQMHAVHLQGVEGIGDLVQAALHIRQGQRREGAETAGEILAQLRHVFVAHAHERAGLLHIAKPDAGIAQARDGGGDAILVHLLHGALGRPLGHDGRGIVGAAQNELALRGEPFGGIDVVMHVDAARGGGWLLGQSHGGGGEGGGAEAFQKAAPSMQAKARQTAIFSRPGCLRAKKSHDAFPRRCRQDRGHAAPRQAASLAPSFGRKIDPAGWALRARALYGLSSNLGGARRPGS